MLSATYSLSDFTPIAMVATQPYSLMVSKSVPSKNVRDLVALLKADPGKFNGGQGSGTGYFLLSVLNREMGVGVETIAYKGTTEAVVDLLAGRIRLLFAPITTAFPFYVSGEARWLGFQVRNAHPLCPTFRRLRKMGISSIGYFHLVCLARP